MSERALRYYQQIGLLVPACTTPGGLRRYSADDLARVARIRELQTLLGLNLDEIAVVLRNEDRIAQIRLTYHDERTSEDQRRQLTRECLVLPRTCGPRSRPSGTPWRASWPTWTPASARPGPCSPAPRPRVQYALADGAWAGGGQRVLALNMFGVWGLGGKRPVQSWPGIGCGAGGTR